MAEEYAVSGNLYAPRPPPVAKRVAHSVTHHGQVREDPWHWLRDAQYPHVQDADILAYLHAENDYFEAVMSPHQRLRQRLYEEIKARHPEAESSVPYRDGSWLYQWRFAAGSEYRTWWRKSAFGGGRWQCFLNEPELAASHAYFRLGGFDVSPDGSLVTWAVDTSGAERFKAFVRALPAGVARTLDLPGMLATPVFAMDGDSLVYVTVNEHWRPWQVWVHSLSGKQPDKCLYEESDERFRVHIDITRSREFLVISTGDHATSECLLVPASSPWSPPSVVAPRTRGCRYSLEHAHGRIYLLINDTHENFRVVSFPESQPARHAWREEIPASDSVYPSQIDAFEKWLVVSEMSAALERVRVREYTGEEHWIEFPESLYSASLGTNPTFDTEHLRINFESLVTPETVHDYSPTERRLLHRKTRQVPGYDATRFTSGRLWAPARDGQSIPVSLVSLRDTANGSAPDNSPRALHLYGYGAYGAGIRPTFNLARLSLLERGVTFAIAHVRGGDELGYRWYLDGKLDKRCNTFNDFVDVARHLIEIGETAPHRIAISGGSAGGELMGAVLNQAPELWGAVVAHVPFVDVLNTMLDADLPLTPPEWDEWGNPIRDAEACELIASYCPYTQTRARAYPPILVTAGLNDPRVTYWEPAKWVARLRHVKTDRNVLIFKTNMGSGHAGKSGRFERIREIADEQAFILQALQITGASPD